MLKKGQNTKKKVKTKRENVEFRLSLDLSAYDNRNGIGSGIKNLSS